MNLDDNADGGVPEPSLRSGPAGAMRFGAGCIPHRYDRYAEWVRTAEATGFHTVGTGDSPTLWADPFVTLSIAAQQSTRLRLTLDGSNPVLRHPVAAASASASLQMLSGGRFSYGLGSGDSAVANIGRPRAKLAEVEMFGRSLQGLCAGREVSYDGQSLRLRWAAAAVPVLLCAEGPKTQRLAGRFADGAILYNGITREVIDASLANLRAGAKEAGRSLDDLDVRWVAVCHLAPTIAEGVEAVKFSLAGTANRAFRHSLADKLVPERLQAGFRGLQAEYRSEHHQQLGRHHGNAALLDRFGLTDYLVERFAIVGPAEHCVERLTELRSYGVTALTLSFLSQDLDQQIATMHQLAEEVFPHVG